MHRLTFLWSVYSDADAPTHPSPSTTPKGPAPDRDAHMATPRARKGHLPTLDREKRGKAPVHGGNSAGRRESFARRGRVGRSRKFSATFPRVVWDFRDFDDSMNREMSSRVGCWRWSLDSNGTNYDFEHELFCGGVAVLCVRGEGLRSFAWVEFFFNGFSFYFDVCFMGFCKSGQDFVRMIHKYWNLWRCYCVFVWLRLYGGIKFYFFHVLEFERFFHVMFYN